MIAEKPALVERNPAVKLFLRPFLCGQVIYDGSPLVRCEIALGINRLMSAPAHNVFFQASVQPCSCTSQDWTAFFKPAIKCDFKLASLS